MEILFAQGQLATHEGEPKAPTHRTPPRTKSATKSMGDNTNKIDADIIQQQQQKAVNNNKTAAKFHNNKIQKENRSQKYSELNTGKRKHEEIKENQEQQQTTTITETKEEPTISTAVTTTTKVKKGLIQVTIHGKKVQIQDLPRKRKIRPPAQQQKATLRNQPTLYSYVGLGNSKNRDIAKTSASSNLKPIIGLANSEPVPETQPETDKLNIPIHINTRPTQESLG